MFKWLHHLRNPHCIECEDEKIRREDREDRKRICRTCEVLEMQCAQLRSDNERLLSLVLDSKENSEENQVKYAAGRNEEFSPIQPPLRWKERRKILENESRQRARVLDQQREELISAVNTEKLEQALKVDIPESRDNANAT